MFRELVRKKQKLSEQACVSLLCRETRGVLSVQGDDGYPYGMPMNHWYDPSDGTVWFHSGKIGHRTDALRRNDKVSFCVYDSGSTDGGHWAKTVQSVIIFGRIEIVDDIQTVRDVARKLSYKFTRDEAYITKEIEDNAHRTLLLHLYPEQMIGKRVVEE